MAVLPYRLQHGEFPHKCTCLSFNCIVIRGEAQCQSRLERSLRFSDLKNSMNFSYFQKSSHQIFDVKKYHGYILGERKASIKECYNKVFIFFICLPYCFYYV